MFVMYCADCLPIKVVLAWGTQPSQIVHSEHAGRSRHFELSEPEWASVWIRDNARQTANRSVTVFGDRFV